MKHIILENIDDYAYFSFTLYLPTFKWRQKISFDIGGEQSETTAKMGTEFTVRNSKHSFEIIVRLLGIGIGLYLREIR